MKKLLFLFLISSILYSQDTIYYNKDFSKINSFKASEYFKITVVDEQDSSQFIQRTFYKTGELKQEEYFLKINKERINSKSWYKEGQLHLESTFKEGKLDGFFKSYWKSGKLKRMDFYRKGRLAKGVCYNESEEEVPYYDFEVRPSFPGGEESLHLYLNKNINYSNISSNSETTNSVVVVFSIDIEGQISDIEIVKSANKYLDNLVIKAINKMPKWNPGMRDGELVKVKYRLPVTF